MSLGTIFGLLLKNCEDGNPDIVSRLVQVPGLDLNQHTRFGDTAAIRASMEGQTDIVRNSER